MYEVRYINYLYAMGMSSDDPILQWLFSSRQRNSNHFSLTTHMFSGWVLYLHQWCHNIRFSHFKQFWRIL